MPQMSAAVSTSSGAPTVLTFDPPVGVVLLALSGTGQARVARNGEAIDASANGSILAGAGYVPIGAKGVKIKSISLYGDSGLTYYALLPDI